MHAYLPYSFISVVVLINPTKSFPKTRYLSLRNLITSAAVCPLHSVGRHVVVSSGGMLDRRGEVVRLLAKAVAKAVGAPQFRATANTARGTSSRQWQLGENSCASWFHRDCVAKHDLHTSRVISSSFATKAGGANETAPTDTKRQKPTLKGITVRPNGRVSVRISGGGVPQKGLGTFDSMEDAVGAYNVEAISRGVSTQELSQNLGDTKVTKPENEMDSRNMQSSMTTTNTPSPDGVSSSESSSAFDEKNKNRETRKPSDLQVDRDLQRRYTTNHTQTPEDLMSIIMDLKNPGQWYPAARNITRKIHLHVGPTNSGKTYSAIQKLKQAESGVYCSPLRLLAWEVAEGINSAVDDLNCNLVTGQEKKLVVGSKHVACTVEMADTNRVVDVAVIDEAHLLGDASRGYAFSRAILGLPAKELHLCGDPAMVPLVELIAAELGDTLTIHRYERLQPLQVLKQPLKKIKDVQSGDCLVAFSRKAVHQLKKDVETEAGKRACVIYGSLPPEARARQAELFNDRLNSGYDVLIASDAIGMGLNLSIKRVIFTTLKKFDGSELRNLLPPEVKQIAGRAGRFGMGSDKGGATTMRKDELKELKKSVNAPVVDLKTACIAPTLDQIALFHEARPDVSLSDILKAFHTDSTPSNHYFPRKCDDMIAAAKLVQHLPLTLEDHWMFAVAPCSAEDIDGPGAKALVTFAEAFVKRGRVSVRTIQAPKFAPPKTQGELSILEQAHNAYDLYLWFSLRCPLSFPEHDYAQALRKACAAAIELGLQRSSTKELRESANALAGYVDADRLNFSIRDARKLEQELETQGFGSENDPDKVHGIVTFTPGGGFDKRKDVGKSIVRSKVTETKKGRVTRRDGKRSKKNLSEINATAKSLKKKTAKAASSDLKPKAGKTTSLKSQKRESLKAIEQRLQIEAAKKERIEKLKINRTTKGYALNFSAPAVERREKRERSEKNALFGSIMRLAGVGDASERETPS